MYSSAGRPQTLPPQGTAWQPQLVIFKAECVAP